MVRSRASPRQSSTGSPATSVFFSASPSPGAGNRLRTQSVSNLWLIRTLRSSSESMASSEMWTLGMTLSARRQATSSYSHLRPVSGSGDGSLLQRRQPRDRARLAGELHNVQASIGTVGDVDVAAVIDL